MKNRTAYSSYALKMMLGLLLVAVPFLFSSYSDMRTRPEEFSGFFREYDHNAWTAIVHFVWWNAFMAIYYWYGFTQQKLDIPDGSMGAIERAYEFRNSRFNGMNNADGAELMKSTALLDMAMQYRNADPGVVPHATRRTMQFINSRLNGMGNEAGLEWLKNR